MSSLSVFPAPPGKGEITLCEMNARLIAENYKPAELSKYVPNVGIEERLRDEAKEIMSTWDAIVRQKILDEDSGG